MPVLKTILFAALYIPYGFRKITGTGAFGRRRAKPVRNPAISGDNPLKAALAACHVKQYHEASCSVASVVSVLNALGALAGVKRALVGQQEILERVKTANWKQRMSRNGDSGRRGLPLALLGAVVKNSLDAYRIPYAAVETVPAPKAHRKAARARQILWRCLRNFENNASGLIIAHFDQGIYLPALNIPHISPVGGFDPLTGEVTILDVDPGQPRPYTVGFDRFYQGLASDYFHLFRPFGYAGGGYVHIELG